MCDLFGVRCRCGERIIGLFKKVLYVRRISMGSVFAGKTKVGREFGQNKPKLAVC